VLCWAQALIDVFIFLLDVASLTIVLRIIIKQQMDYISNKCPSPSVRPSVGSGDDEGSNRSVLSNLLNVLFASRLFEQARLFFLFFFFFI
jgi:hypothetical protein